MRESVTVQQVLAQVIANHFPGSTLREESGEYTVDLGEGLPSIAVTIRSVDEQNLNAVMFTLVVYGGGFGMVGSTINGSGYGETLREAVVMAACNWACAFGPVLLAGIGRPDLISTEDPRYEQFETTLDGRRYLVTSGHLDRGINADKDEVSAWRERLGGSIALTSAVLGGGTIPASRSNDVIGLETYLGIGPKNLPEVKYGLDDWTPAINTWQQVPNREDGYRMLREWATLSPLEPAPPLTRELVQRYLDLLAALGDDASSPAGWLGGRYHGMRLGEVATPEQLAEWGALPERAKWFFENIAVTGAGPGYGLDVRHLGQGWLHLAEAGCGAFWVLRLQDGAVGLDSCECDGQVQQVAPDVMTWFEKWLDQMLRGAPTYGVWDHSADVPAHSLSKLLAEHRPENLADVSFKLAIRTGEGCPVGPCHACEQRFAQFGIASSVFSTAPRR